MSKLPAHYIPPPSVPLSQYIKHLPKDQLQCLDETMRISVETWPKHLIGSAQFRICYHIHDAARAVVGSDPSASSIVTPVVFYICDALADYRNRFEVWYLFHYLNEKDAINKFDRRDDDVFSLLVEKTKQIAEARRVWLCRLANVVGETLSKSTIKIPGEQE